MIKLDLQMFGGRGASSSSGGSRGGATGGLNPGNIVSTTSLTSAREGKEAEVDQVLTVARDIYNDFGVEVNDLQIATLKGAGKSTLAYYDAGGNLAYNKAYFNAKTMDKAYDSNVEAGFHPSRGNKTGIEAVVAHEMGHALTDEIAKKKGYGDWQLDRASTDIVKQAAKNSGYGNKTKQFISKISGYAETSHAEALAEAFADVYCNGNKARKESTAIVNEMKTYFK